MREEHAPCPMGMNSEEFRLSETLQNKNTSSLQQQQQNHGERKMRERERRGSRERREKVGRLKEI